MAKIEEGQPVEYENVIIYGDLDLHRLDLPFNKNKGKIINSIIKIEYSVIKGDVFFDLVEACEYLIVIETLLGWLLMALFLVTLSRVMLR